MLPPGGVPPGGRPPMAPPGVGPPQPQAQPQPQPQPRSAGSNPLDPYAIAARIKKANPNIRPDTLFRAVTNTINTFGPMAQLQYRQEMQDFKNQMQAQTLEERIREADQRIAQGADRIAAQRDALDIRMQIAQLGQQGLNDRKTADLQSKLDQLLVKAGIAPTGDKTADLGAAAKSNADREAAKQALAQGKLEQTKWYQDQQVEIKEKGLSQAAERTEMQERVAKLRLETQQRGQDLSHQDRVAAAAGAGSQAAHELAAAKRSALNDQLTDIRQKNMGYPPAVGTEARKKYDDLVRQRDAAAKDMIDARKGNPKLRAWNDSKNALEGDAAGTKDNPAKPTSQADYDALPSGAYFQDDEGVKKKP
jgi:hypothetical protein